jgi:PAS domain S-box-containing protein
MNRWFNVYATRVGDAASRRVAIVFDNITERKQAEQISRLAAKFDAFRIALADALRPLVDPVEIQATASRVLGEYLGVNRVVYFEVRDPDYVVERDYVNGATPLIGRYPIDSFGAKLLEAYRAGRTVVAAELAADPYLSPEQQIAYAAIQIGAHIAIPLVKGGEFVAGLAIHASQPREWTPDEITLCEEVAERTWAAIERARAEATVAANLRDTQQLRELGAQLAIEDDIQTLYREILATAIALTGADAGTVQILDDRTQDLCILAAQSFDSAMTAHFARVSVSSNTFCGRALRSGTRMFEDFDAPDSPDPDGSKQIHLEAGLVCAQSTPLISRTGKTIGMVSTHWRTRHRSSIRELQFLDLLARQAADIIEQRETTAALRDREEQLRLATEASKLGMWFWNLAPDILTWTERCKAIFGLAADTEMSYEIFLAALHPDDRQRTHEAVTRSMAERTDYDIEYRCCWPDGSVHWIAAKGSCTYDPTGSPLQMMGVALDITDRKRVEEALRASEAQLAEELVDMQQLQQISSQLIRQDSSATFYQQILDTAIALMAADMGSVHMLDPDRDRLRLLASRGLHPAAAEFWQWVDADAGSICGTAVATGERRLVPDLETCDFSTGTTNLDYYRLSEIAAVQSTPLISRDGRIVGVISTHWRTPHQPSARRLRSLDLLARQVADSIDRQQAEATLAERARQLTDLNSRLARSEIQLTERNQELNSFVHIVSHDLKAPLRAVSNLSEWIEEDFEGAVSANTTAQMNLLRGRVQRMEGMIDGLLEYARVGRQDSQLELVSVADLLTEVIESIAPTPTFTIDITSPLPTVAANRLLLSQVFANLIGNAFKHHDRSDGCIRVSSRDLGEFYEFAVTDDGPGIAPAYRDRVFVIFQSANSQKHPDSTGIGLSIVKKIVETAGGRIWLESELGKGTTFYFTWPTRSID